MTRKELRKKLRNLKPYFEELEIGNNVIIKTGSSYAVRNKDDHDDPMTDYSAYIYGFKESWVINMCERENLLTA